MARFTPGHLAYAILTHIGMVSEFPYTGIELLGKRHTAVTAIRVLREEKYIVVTGSGAGKTLRLTQKGINQLREISEDYYNHYMQVSYNGHIPGASRRGDGSTTPTTSNDKIKWRNHRIAEVVCFLEAVGCSIWMHEKPLLTANVRERAVRINEDDMLFYTSRELKQIDVQQRYKIDFTRLIGVMFSPGGIYSVYNTNYGRIKWHHQGEGKMQVFLNDIVSNNCSPNTDDVYKSLIFTKDINIGIEIMTGKQYRNMKGFELLKLDNVYDNIYIVPLGVPGLLQLRILTEKNGEKKLREKLFKPELLTDEQTSNCDAIADGQYIMSFFTGNIAKLSRFINSMEFSSPEHFEILCFEWQQDFLQKCTPEGTTIRVIPFDTIMSFFQ